MPVFIETEAHSFQCVRYICKFRNWHKKVCPNYFLKWQVFHENTKVVSNFCQYNEDGLIVGLKPPMIHMYNKVGWDQAALDWLIWHVKVFQPVQIYVLFSLHFFYH